MNVGRVTFRIDPAFIKDGLPKAVNAGLTAAAKQAVIEIKASFPMNGKFNPSAPGTPPNRHNDILYNALSFTRAENLTATVYTSGVVYAYKQEFGGWIQPRFKRYLTVPLNIMAARDREKHGSLEVLPLRCFKSRSGKLFLAQAVKQRGYRGKIKSAGMLMYVLKDRVRLPERPYMRPAFTNARVIANMIREFCTRSQAVMGKYKS
jgi:hypothetical protein